MKTTLCTLYNSLYLDKGLVLYKSLKECAKDFELYVLCMDEKCYEILSDIGEDRLKPIHLSDVENDKMLEAKNNRPMAEYCWTCSSRLIQYILETYQSECCTYIDADMYFYHDPQLLIDELLTSGKSVMMVPHRFSESKQHQASMVGTYCVEFNCFKNDQAGLKVLNHWHNKCLECCSNLGDGIHWGDQKYMDEWPTLFPKDVHVCEHSGAGVAPWNIEWYRTIDNDNKSLVYKKDNKRIQIVFYHFQSIKYISRKKVSIGLFINNKHIDYSLVESLYYPYITKIDKVKDYLSDKYGVDILIKRHPSEQKKIFFKEIARSIKRKLTYKLRKDKPYIINL